MILEKTVENFTIKKELFRLGFNENEALFLEKEILKQIYLKSEQTSLDLEAECAEITKIVVDKYASKRGYDNLKKHNFNESAVMGQLGVIILTHYLLFNRVCERVINLDEDMSQQFQGYDLVLQLDLTSGNELAKKWFDITGKKVLKVEVKTDAQDYSGNIALEIYSNYDSGRKGWSTTSKSDLIFYFFINTHKLYVFETKKLQGLSLFFNQKFEPLANEFNKINNIPSSDLAGLDLIVFPSNSNYLFQDTPFGRKNLANGGIYSIYDKAGKLKSYISRRFLLVDAQRFFEGFGESKPSELFNRFDIYNEETYKMFRFTYVKAKNVGNGRNFFSLCILFPIITLRLLNIFLDEILVPRESCFEMQEGVKFVRGGNLEKTVYGSGRNSKFPVREKMSFTSEEFENMLLNFKNNVAVKYLDEKQVKESFLI